MSNKAFLGLVAVLLLLLGWLGWLFLKSDLGNPFTQAPVTTASPSSSESAIPSSKACVPAVPLVDPNADASASCLAAQLDLWKASNLMGVGQQVQEGQSPDFTGPVTSLLPLSPASVGFDLAGFTNAVGWGADPMPELSQWAKEGMFLTATWHTDNPGTGGRFDDRTWTDVGQLLAPDTQAYKAFWANWDLQLISIKRFQDLGIPIIFYPFHEIGGDWFWWGQADPDVIKKVFSQMQTRAWDAGVHNVLWGHAGAAPTRSKIANPALYVPSSVDIVGLDYYDASPGASDVDLSYFAEMSALAPRMALTEVGPSGPDGAQWDPGVIQSSLNAKGLYAAYANFWYDGKVPSEIRQISSLTKGPAWLASCPGGVCQLEPREQAPATAAGVGGPKQAAIAGDALVSAIVADSKARGVPYFSYGGQYYADSLWRKVTSSSGFDASNPWWEMASSPHAVVEAPFLGSLPASIVALEVSQSDYDSPGKTALAFFTEDGFYCSGPEFSASDVGAPPADFEWTCLSKSSYFDQGQWAVDKWFAD